MRETQERLHDLMHEIERVERFTAAGKAVFMADERDQYAVMMAYARIGEISKNIPDELLMTQPQVEWRNIKGFRDVLLHRYFTINIERVWEAIEKLPALRTAAEAMLASLPPEDEA